TRPLRPLFHVPDPAGPALDGLPHPPRRVLLDPRVQYGRWLLLGHGPQLRPDLLRRLLLAVRPRVRPRAALPAEIALPRHLPQLLHPPDRRRLGARPQLERGADAARARPGHGLRPGFEHLQLQPAVPGQPGPRPHPQSALVDQPPEDVLRPDRPGPGRLHRYDLRLHRELHPPAPPAFPDADAVAAQARQEAGARARLRAGAEDITNLSAVAP